MDRVDLTPPTGAVGRRADAYATAPLLNCLLREVAEPLPGTGEHRVHRLPGGRLLRVRAGRRPTDPELCTAGTWRRIGHPELVKLVAEELRRHTGLPGGDLPAEMIDSREAVAALLTARARGPQHPRTRICAPEQSLLTGHPYHPAPKARGGGPVTSWLPYAPEAHARFPLVLLGVREDQVAEEGDTRALDALGTAPRPATGCCPPTPGSSISSPATSRPPSPTAGCCGSAPPRSTPSPTAAVRTIVRARPRPCFLKFSLDVRITNDIRRLWRHDLGEAPPYRHRRRTRLRGAGPVRGLAGATAATAPPPSPSRNWPSWSATDCAAICCRAPPRCSRRGLAGRASRAARWPPPPTRPAGGRRICARSYRPALTAFADHGVVLEAHLQNTLIAVDAAGTPVQALFRDAEGTKLLPDTTRAAGWERLVYCLVVNHLVEIAGALADHHPGLDPWPAARRELARHDLPEIPALLTAPTLPGKTNLLLRWTGADGADARYLPLPNPLAD